MVGYSHLWCGADCTQSHKVKINAAYMPWVLEKWAVDWQPPPSLVGWFLSRKLYVGLVLHGDGVVVLFS